MKTAAKKRPHPGGRPRSIVPKTQITIRISPEAHARLMLTVRELKAAEDRPRSLTTPGCVVETAIWEAFGPLPVSPGKAKRLARPKRRNIS